MSKEHELLAKFEGHRSHESEIINTIPVEMTGSSPDENEEWREAEIEAARVKILEISTMNEQNAAPIEEIDYISKTQEITLSDAARVLPQTFTKNLN